MDDSKPTKRFKVWEKIIISCFTFLMFSFIGIVIWGAFKPMSIWPPVEMIKDLWQPLLFVALPASILAYKYPRIFNVILRFFPAPGVSS